MNDETIVLGGGCFWCGEAIFKMIKGVKRITPGYAGGHTVNPTYEDVCNGQTGHAEVVEIVYDSDETTLEKILEVFFKMHDPTSLNKQGADFGSEYRSIILYTSQKQREEIEDFIKNSQKDFDRPIVTEVKKLGRFYQAEDYHKNFYEKNPFQPYCIFVTRPKIKKIKEEFKEELKADYK
jgi:methionine-S-sulfoxide reductase